MRPRIASNALRAPSKPSLSAAFSFSVRRVKFINNSMLPLWRGCALIAATLFAHVWNFCFALHDGLNHFVVLIQRLTFLQWSAAFRALIHHALPTKSGNFAAGSGCQWVGTTRVLEKPISSVHTFVTHISLSRSVLAFLYLARHMLVATPPQ